MGHKDIGRTRPVGLKLQISSAQKSYIMRETEQELWVAEGSVSHLASRGRHLQSLLKKTRGWRTRGLNVKPCLQLGKANGLMAIVLECEIPEIVYKLMN
jgi:hypothetical protein